MFEICTCMLNELKWKKNIGKTYYSINILYINLEQKNWQISRHDSIAGKNVTL